MPRPIMEEVVPTTGAEAARAPQRTAARALPVAPVGERPAKCDLSGVEGFFARHPVFTHAEFDAFYQTIEPLNRRRLDEKLDAFRDAGRVLRVNYSLWITVPGGAPRRMSR